MQHIIKRAHAKTPPFFTKLRDIGLTITAGATVILTTSTVLPAVLVTAAGYLLTAGLVASAVSQLTVTNENLRRPKKAVKKGGDHDAIQRS